MIPVLRTLLPMVAGSLASWLAARGFSIDTEALVAALTVLFSFAYWLAGYLAQKYNIKVLSKMLPGPNPTYQT